MHQVMANKKASKPDNTIAKVDVSAVLNDLIQSNNLSEAEKKIILEANQRIAGLTDTNKRSADDFQIGLWSWQVGTEKIKWNDELKIIFEVPLDEEITVNHYWASVHPEDAQDLQSTVEKAISLNSSYRFRHRIITKSGKTRWLDCQGRVSLNSD